MRLPLSLLISLFTILSATQAGELIPFTLPWDDDAGGITDLSSYNHMPAGKHGYISVDDDAHFTAGGERVRFWGVNITANSCFPTHAEAEGIAGRLAKFGFNIVRFHHMDNNWGSGSIIDYAQGNSRNLHAANLERLDYFIAQLKAKGIYSNINLINSRDFKIADGLDSGVENIEWKVRHVLGFVDDTFRDLEKEYAANLLNHVNAYTGLTYGNDPAIAVVEINNENGIFHQYFGGGLNLWPQVYKDQLQEKWNAWLQARYANNAAMLDAWSGVSEPLGDELILDPTFTNGTANWNIEQHDVATVTATTGEFDGRQSLKLQVTNIGTAGWHIQINQGNKALVKDQLYTLSFWVKADAPTTLDATIGLNYDPWSGVQGFSNIEATTTWLQKTYLFNAGVSDTNLRLNFNGIAQTLQTVYLSDISLRSGGSLVAILPDGESLETANIASNTPGGSYTTDRSVDWTRFLSELATEYWTDMGDYIKTDLGYNGLVNGTTIMNTTPNIQSGFDLVDTHAYWQHPVFPGTEWDSNNWYVNPNSMVNTISGTIADLARQRIDGYPHTVSEYRHSYPNPYASEGPLLIGAYGALQDWDGVYFFDYAKGDSWDQGYWDNYFNMNAHPSSMANALAAANLFRRGDVSAAQGQTLMNFNPELEAKQVTAQGAAWNVGDGRKLGIPPEFFATQRIALSIGENATGATELPTAPSGPIYASDTDELSWDLSTTDKGVVSIDTPKTVGMIGYVDGRTFGTDQVGIEIGDTEQDWASITITLMEGSFERTNATSQILIVATGLTENTNMVWTDETKSSVGPNWGEAPSMTEAIPATISLPYAPDRVQAWALDATGQRGNALAVSTTNDDLSSIAIGGDQKSLWYEVQVEATDSEDPYLLWRDQQFDSSEQANASISGPAADPDGDGILNLIEFFAQYDPKTFNSDIPITQTIEWRNERPIFIYEFSIHADYPTTSLHISTTPNLADWSTIALDDSTITLTHQNVTNTHDTLRIEYAPTDPAIYTRLGGN